MKLSQGTVQQDENLSPGVKRESRAATAAASAASAAADKLKASNFPALLLRIGSWEVCLRFVVSLLCLGTGFLLIDFDWLKVLFFGSINRDMKVTWWQSVTLLNINLSGKFLKVV